MAVTEIYMARLLFVYQNNSTLPPSADPFKNTLDTEVITLQLDNGSIETISENGERTIINQQGTVVGAQQGTFLNYRGYDINDKLVYNTLNIPNGKEFDIVISDGTQVKPNSRTCLQQPC